MLFEIGLGLSPVRMPETETALGESVDIEVALRFSGIAAACVSTDVFNAKRYYVVLEFFHRKYFWQIEVITVEFPMLI